METFPCSAGLPEALFGDDVVGGDGLVIDEFHLGASDSPESATAVLGVDDFADTEQTDVVVDHIRRLVVNTDEGIATPDFSFDLFE